MNAFPRHDALELVNCTEALVRARLLCTGCEIWDGWIGPAGTVTVPRFAPPKLKVEARLTDQRVRVTYGAQTPWLASPTNVTARLERRIGADLFSLPATGTTMADTLHLANSCAAMLEYAVRYADSPYVMRGCLAPGATRVIKHGSLELVVVLNGISVQQALPAPHGRWLIAMQPQTGSFAVIDGMQQLDELHDQGLAAPAALHRIAT